MDLEIRFGHFSISLPAYTSNKFSIFEDLADFFDLEYQSEAVKTLKKKIKELELKPKPSIDFESDNTHIESRSAETIITVSNLIMNLTVPEKRIRPTEIEIENILLKLKTWKKPEKQKWNVGDIFSIKLKDHSYSFGQVVGKHTANIEPICTLFELNKKDNLTNYNELKKCRPISVWNCGSLELDNFTFKIILKSEVIVDPKKVKDPKVSGGETFESLANVFYGLEPWNVMFEQTYYDTLLQKGVKRPKNIIWLNENERLAYRKEKFNLDENNNYIKQKL